MCSPSGWGRSDRTSNFTHLPVSGHCIHFLPIWWVSRCCRRPQGRHYRNDCHLSGGLAHPERHVGPRSHSITTIVLVGRPTSGIVSPEGRIPILTYATSASSL